MDPRKIEKISDNISYLKVIKIIKRCANKITDFRQTKICNDKYILITFNIQYQFLIYIRSEINNKHSFTTILKSINKVANFDEVEVWKRSKFSEIIKCAKEIN